MLGWWQSMHVDRTDIALRRACSPFIAADASYLLFSANRPGGLGQADLHACFKKADGSWSVPINLGKQVNSSGIDDCPMVSPDGRCFFYMSTRNGRRSIWWMTATFLDTLRKKHGV